MGIDIYMKWKDADKADKEAQVTGFSTAHGHVGYLREAYHGGPYVTKHLVAEAFSDAADEQYDLGGKQIPATTLRSRLDSAVLLSLIREANVYHGNDGPSPIELSGDFDVDNLGKEGSPVPDFLVGGFNEIKSMKAQGAFEGVIPEAAARQFDAWKKGLNLPDFAQAFVDFVELAEKKEAETGEPVRVYVSY